MLLLKRIHGTSVLAILAFATVAATPHDITTDATPLQTLYMVKQLFPQTKTVGLMWQQTDVNSSDLIPKINRAASAVGVEVVIEDVEKLREVPEQFRDLTQKYHVQVLWIFNSQDMLAGSIAESYLIKNSTMNGVALFAPSADWVSAGACATVLSNGTDANLVVNQKTINALGVKVPAKYVPITQFLATN